MPSTAPDEFPLEIAFAIDSSPGSQEWNDRFGGKSSLQSTHLCGICDRQLVLLIQLSTTVNGFDRLLELFVCPSFLPLNQGSGLNAKKPQSSCSSHPLGWLVQRTKKKSKNHTLIPPSSANPSKTKPTSLLSSWGSTPWPSFGSSSFGSSSFGSSSAPIASLDELLEKRNAGYSIQPVKQKSESKMIPSDPLSESIKNLSLSTEEQIILQSWTLEFYPGSPVDSDKKHWIDNHGEMSIKDFGKEETDWKDEGYEKMQIPGVTKSFKAFQKAVQAEPDQILRYQWNGRPLFYGDDQVSMELRTKGPPKCHLCGSRRVFECQLMPFIHQLLESDPLMESQKTKESKQTLLESLQTGMDWGTVLVYSCENDCDQERDEKQVFTATEHVAIQLELH